MIGPYVSTDPPEARLGIRRTVCPGWKCTIHPNGVRRGRFSWGRYRQSLQDWTLAGAGTLGIHLRWLPRARIEIPFRDCRRGNRIALGKSSDDQRAFTPRNQPHHRVVSHECRRLGIEPGASEPGSRRQSITPPPQARGGSDETSRCHHGPRALPLRAAMRPDPLSSPQSITPPPQARGGSNETSRCHHGPRALPLRAAMRPDP